MLLFENIMPRSLKLVAALLALGLGVGACGEDSSGGSGDGDDSADVDGSGKGGFVERGAETVSVESDVQVLTASLIASSASSAAGLGMASADPMESPIHPTDRPRHGGAHGGARAIFSPRDCLDVGSEATSGEVTYTFNRCRGPGGLRELTGGLRVRSREEGDALVLELRADALVIGSTTVTLSASASITGAGVERSMHWTGLLTGQSDKGREFERKSERTTSWRLGDACHTLDGRSEGTISGREIVTKLQGIRRCRRECPEPGGKLIVMHVRKNERYELSFDGSDLASFDGPQGKTTVRLRCTR